MKITAVLIVEEVESSLPFWVDRLGFTRTVEVPEGNRLGFVILAREGAELMIQSLESVRKDAAQFAPEELGANKPGSTGLFIEVDDFEDIVRRVAGYPVALTERTTFYGMREIGVLAPSGHTVVFGARVAS